MNSRLPLHFSSPHVIATLQLIAAIVIGSLLVLAVSATFVNLVPAVDSPEISSALPDSGAAAASVLHSRNSNQRRNWREG